LSPDNARERLDKCALIVGYVFRQKICPVLNEGFRYEDILGKPPWKPLTDLGTDRVIAILTITAFLAGDLGRDEDPVTFAEPVNRLSGLDNFAADLVPLYQRRPGKPVPLDNVAPADAARMDLDEHLSGTGFRSGYLLQSYVFVVMPD
jgi:hypothetical protein